MSKQHSSKAIELECTLTELAAISSRASAQIRPEKKKCYAQYFTERAVAKQMARMLPLDKGVVLGDHGAGTGILSATVIAHVLSALDNSEDPFILQAYEIDEDLYSAFNESIDVISRYAEELMQPKPGVNLKGDFTEIAETLLSGKGRGVLDAAILNPPYKKLGQKTQLAQLMREKLAPMPNIYTVFMALTIIMLKPGGQMVAIVPRSFCNGSYFKKFRVWMKTQGSFDWFVRYKERSNIFRGDNVLQENITFRFTRGVSQRAGIRVSLCDSPEHAPLFESIIPATDIFPEYTDMILVPTDQGELEALHFMRSLPYTTENLGLQITTGKFEDFRMRKLLHQEPPAVDWAPVIYSQHWQRGDNDFSWQASIQGKPSCLVISGDSRKKLLPRGNYVLIKRISANDDRSGRCHPIALLEDNSMPGNWLAIDNHIQVISGIEGRPLRPQEAIALANYLSWPHIDPVLRVVSGTTQLNKADLLQLRYSYLFAERAEGQIIK